MSSSWHPRTGELGSKDDGPSQLSRSHEGQPVESTPFYFGGPLFGIYDPTSPRDSIYTNKDGTRVVFDVDPRSAATRNLVKSAKGKSQNLRLAACEIFCVDKLGAEKQLTSPTSARSSIMASNENNTNLILLADAALGTCSHEGQQPAHAAPAQGAVAANTTPPANTINIANASLPAPQQPSQAALSQGFTAINPAAITGGFTPINPHPLPRHMPAPIGPSGGRQRVTKRSPKYKPRTTGYNRSTGEGMLTNVCGIATPAKGTAKANKKTKGNFHCPRCNGRFTRARTVKDHFITCVNKYGNPSGLHWWDHQTLQASKDWHLEHLPTVEEEDDIEGEEEGDEEGDEQGQYEVDGSTAQAIDSDVAAGEEDQDGDAYMGEEDQGRDPSVSTESAPFYDDDGDSVMG